MLNPIRWDHIDLEAAEKLSFKEVVYQLTKDLERGGIQLKIELEPKSFTDLLSLLYQGLSEPFNHEEQSIKNTLYLADVPEKWLHTAPPIPVKNPLEHLCLCLCLRACQKVWFRKNYS